MTRQLLGARLAAAMACAGVMTPVAAQDTVIAKTEETQLDPEAVTLGQEIVALGYPERAREAMFGGVADTIIAQMAQVNEARLAEADPEVREFLRERQQDLIAEFKKIMAKHIPTMMDGLALAYADAFTVSELADIRDFVATPSGQAFIEGSMALVGNPRYVATTQPFLNEVSEAARRWQQEAIAELQTEFGSGTEQR